MPRGRIGIALVLCLGAATVSSADPLIVTSGHYRLDNGENGEWVLEGEGFRLGGEGIAQQIAFWECLLCAPGTPLSLDARLTLDVPFEGNATAEAGGAFHDTVFWQGEFNLSSGTVAAAFDAVESLPFTFTGWLNGYSTPDFSGTPFFSSDLAGSGMAHIRFFRQEVSPGGKEVASISYQFSDSDPVPEPGALLLVGSGLTGVVAARRRRMATGLSSAR